MPDDPDTALRQGQRLLKALLPKARAEARRGADMGLEAKSGLAKPLLPFLKEKNLLALQIYPAALGGWHADLVLRSTPPGVPRIIGSPVSNPLSTRQEAEKMGYDLLVTVLARERAHVAEVEARPTFELHGLEIALHPDNLAELAKLDPADGTYGTSEAAEARIAETLGLLLPEGVTAARLRALEGDARARLVAVLHVAAMSGVIRYPPREVAPPRSRRH